MDVKTKDQIFAGYMGRAEEQLFYCYHAPQGANHRSFGFVLCYPTGREYIYAHRGFKQLAIRLARTGFPVLRFDYYATGDSAGEDGMGDFAHWTENIVTAIATLRRHSNVHRIILAGFRVGASLAVLVALKRMDIDGLILWDPVVDGASYMDKLIQTHERLLTHNTSHDKYKTASNDLREVLGYYISPTLESDLRAINLSTLSHIPAPKILLMSSSEQADPDGLTEQLIQLGVAVDTGHVIWPEFWTGSETIGDVLMAPARVLQTLITWAQKEL